MFQKNAQPKPGESCSHDLEQRLTAYYGPALPPHPLPESAWLQLRAQLEQTRQEKPRGPASGAYLPGCAHLRRSQIAPASLQQTFATLITQTDSRRQSPALRCRFSERHIQPRAQIALLGHGQVRLLLPARTWRSLQASELEVLLAVGLARYASASRALFLLTRALFVASLLVTLAALPFMGVDRRSLWIFCLAFACCLAGACLIVWQERALAFRGDRQAVQWLGRERVCQGLHLLAERSHPRRRPAWGEPSLTERIARICGTSVRTKDEHLTLVG